MTLNKKATKKTLITILKILAVFIIANVILSFTQILSAQKHSRYYIDRGMSPVYHWPTVSEIFLTPIVMITAPLGWIVIYSGLPFIISGPICLLIISIPFIFTIIIYKNNHKQVTSAKKL